LRYFYYFTGAFVASFGILTLAGFPPLAGFFLKMHLSEIFIANKNFYTLATILLTSVLTIYVYYNLVVAMYSEHERVNDASRGFYVPRISMPEFFDFVLFLILFFILCLLAWFIPDTNFFWTFAKNTAAFFSNNHLYANDLYIESVKAAAASSNVDASAPAVE
jgi:NADH:ubiquinone oxidoreductase subunit 2 (subunit N)